ncbi:MAG: hypothetical protein HQL06_09305 [Nitrospirae bacterium]|nr:hypothetical protein [Nitrospirota bacterium]
MTFTDSFKKGFEVVNKNWAVVAIQLTAIFITLTGFVILIAVPLVLAVVVFGSNLSGILNNFSIEHLASLLTSKHLTIAILLALLFTLYMIIVMLILFFLYGASCGVLARSIKDPHYEFTINGFYVEGKRMFFPLLGYNTVIGLIATAEVIALIVCYFPVSFLIENTSENSSQMANFLEIFAVLISLTVLFFLVSGTLSVTVYGTAILALRGGGVFQTVKASVLFIINKPSAYWFYLVCILGFLGCSLAMMMFGFIISMLPYVGKVLSIPFQLLLQVAQSYMGFLVIASVFSYYYGANVDGSTHSLGILAETAVPINPPQE